MLHVIATIELRPGGRETFLEQFRQLVPLVHAEQGCLAYGPTVDLPTLIPAQVEVRDDVVTVIEQWESVEALEAHLIAPHMNDFRGRVKEVVAGITLQILQPA